MGKIYVYDDEKRKLKDELESIDKSDGQIAWYAFGLFLVLFNWAMVSIIPLYWLYQTMLAKYPFLSRWEMFQWLGMATLFSLGLGTASVIIMIGLAREEGKRIASISSEEAYDEW